MDKLREKAGMKVEPLCKILSERHGVTLNFDGDVEHLASVITHYQAKRDAILESDGRADAYDNPEYSKAVLITEAARLYLREIAPIRTRRKSKKNKTGVSQ